MKLSVSVVIPNWNGVYLLKKHLANVIKTSPGAEIIVSDDNSEDGSADYLRKNFPSVKVIARSLRGGFASNVNSGVKAATGDIVVLLNTDVEPEQGYLKSLLTHFSDPSVFAVGCMEKSAENDKTILRGRGLARWEKGFYVHSRGEVDESDTAWVSGGSGAFRKSMWDRLGGMDTLYNPFYWEDIDLSYRARKAGWKTLFEPASIVHHYHEEGKIKRVFTPSDVKRISYRNQFIFIWKNVNDVSIHMEHFLWAPVRLIQAVLAGDILMLQGFLRAVGKLPLVVKHRTAQKKLWHVHDRDL
jgi:GT2 family glycosyltransferase